MENKQIITRGSIYYVTMPIHDTTEPHSCEKGYRPVVVVSSNVGNNTSNVVMVCPITTKIKDLSCNVRIAWNIRGKQSQILCNQIVAIPRAMLKVCRGYITLQEQRAVDIAMLISLGININYNEVREYASKC